MKITKRQLKRIIREEKAKILKEGSIEDGFSNGEVQEFEQIMGQLSELLDQAFDICGRDAAAKSYWYNTMQGCIEGSATMTPMVETLQMMTENLIPYEELDY